MIRQLAVVAALVAPIAHGQEVDGDFSVSEVLLKVQSTIDRAKQLDTENTLPAVTNVRVNFTVGSKADQHGNVRFFVFKFGSSTITESVQRISLQFAPVLRRSTDSVMPDPSESLAQAINDVAQVGSGFEFGDLQFSGISAYFRFGVTTDEQNGLSFDILDSINVGVGEGQSESLVQEVFIQFGD